ncbi:hypothetical protein U6Q14_12005 [Cutibacterium acnes]
MSYITRTGNLAGAPELREGERGPYTYARVTAPLTVLLTLLEVSP